MSDGGLAISPLLLGLSEEEVQTLLAMGERRSYADGELVVEEGTSSDCLFILTSGSVTVTGRSAATSVLLATLSERGDFFGEMSLIDIMPRSADIHATGKAEILAFPKRELTAFFTRSPRVQMTMILNICRNLSLRLRQADARIVELSMTLQQAGEGNG